jgi:hypothetical protein
MSSLLVFTDWRYMLVFSTQLCELLPLYPSLWFTPPPPFPSMYQSTVYTDSVLLEGGGGVELCWRHILQEFNTLVLTRFRT